MRISWPLGTGIKSQHYPEAVLKQSGRNQELCRHPGLSFPHENPFPEIWCLVKHLLQFWLEALSGKENEAAAKEEAHWEWVSSRLLLCLCCQRLKSFPQLAPGSQSQDALLLLSSCLLEVFITLSAMFSRPGKMASYPCFHERHHSNVSSPRSMQDLQEKVEPAAPDHQDLQAHEVLLVTRDPRAHRVLLGLQGTVTHPPALATAWEVSKRSRDSCRLQRCGWHFLTAQVRWRLPMNLAKKMWWLSKNLRVQCGSTLWDCSTKRRWPSVVTKGPSSDPSL